MKLYPKILLIAIFIIIIPSLTLFLIQMNNFEKKSNELTLERLFKKKEEVNYYLENLRDDNLIQIKENIDSDKIENIYAAYNKIKKVDLENETDELSKKNLEDGLEIVEFYFLKEKIQYIMKIPLYNKKSKKVNQILRVEKNYSAKDYIRYIFSDSYGEYVVHGVKNKGEIFFTNFYNLYGIKNKQFDSDWEIVKEINQRKIYIIKKRDKLNGKYYDSIYFPLISNMKVKAVFQFSIKRDSIEDQIEDNKKNIRYVMVIMLSMSLIATFLISRVFLLPISKVEEFTKIVSKGNLDEKLKLNTKDEFELLSYNINLMVDNLKDKIKTEAILKEQLEKDKLKEEYIGQIEHKNIQIKETLKRLKKAQEELVAKEKLASLGLMAGGVAHELNNPLGAILNNIQMIKMDFKKNNENCSDDLRESFDIIEKATRKSKKIVSDLLTYSKNREKNRESISIIEVILESYGMIKHKLEEKEISFSYEKLENEFIVGNFDSLVKVFVNLFSNSIDALEKSSIKKIEIKSRKFTDEFEIIVEDSGEGINEDIKNKIFDPFFTDKGIGKGTGLGLSIVMGIIKEHKGKIEVETIKDIGTKFKIKFKKIKEV